MSEPPSLAVAEHRQCARGYFGALIGKVVCGESIGANILFIPSCHPIRRDSR
jgi:hypothetical protein